MNYQLLIRYFSLCAGMLAWCIGIAQLPAVSFNHLNRDTELFSSAYQNVVEDQFGFIWFGSLDGGGLYRYDGYDLLSFLPVPTRLESTIAGTRIARIITGHDSTLYVGTQFGFSIMDLVSGEIQNYNNHYDLLDDNRTGVTWSFCVDTINNILWVGTRSGLGMMMQKSDGTLDSFTLLRPSIEPTGARLPLDISDIQTDLKNPDRIWLISFQGLYSYSISKNSFRRHASQYEPSIPTISIQLHRDTDGILWIPARDAHVLSYDPEKNEWRKFPVPDLLRDSTRSWVYRLLPGDDDDLWFGTHTSVGKINIRTQEVEQWTYDPLVPDGLPKHGVFKDVKGDRHGRLWLTSWQGVQYAKQAFVPASKSVTDLRVAITDVKISPTKDEKVAPLIFTRDLSLDQEQRELIFHFVLPNPLEPSKVTYRYMLKGYDKDWLETDQRRARYARLPGGQYTFMVTGREGVQADWLPVTELNVRVEKTLFEHWWVWGLIGLGFLLVAVGIYRLLLVRQRREDQLKAEFDHKLSEIQMQALRAQMNPHFLFNSLNSIKYYAISKSKDETASYLSKFAMLVRAILNNSKSRTISLKDELDALQLYIEIEHLRLEGKFDYLIDIDSSIQIRNAQIPPMILQPYVENAIWHGLMHKEGKGRLLVQVKDLGNQIQCIIEDNGIGRVKAAEIRSTQMDHKKSVGMQITNDRITLINRIYKIDTRVHVIDLMDDHGNAAGTRVVMNIPLIRDMEEE